MHTVLGVRLRRCKDAPAETCTLRRVLHAAQVTLALRVLEALDPVRCRYVEPWLRVRGEVSVDGVERGRRVQGSCLGAK